MAGKRGASSNLNHDNWNEEDEPEEAGTFQKASTNVLKQRIIRTAKRRNPPTVDLTSDQTDETPSKSIFGGFTAFSKVPANPSTSFSFLSSTPLTNGSAFKEPAAIGQPSGTKSTSEGTPSSSLFNFGSSNVKQNKEKSTESELKKTDDKSEEYYAKLKGLNESVLSWIEKHVKENPFISLEPVFKDYEKYMRELDTKNITVTAETKKELSSFTFKPLEKNNNTDTSKSGAQEQNMSESKTSKTQNIQQKVEETPIPKLSFGVPTPTNFASSSFIFGAQNSSSTATTEAPSGFTFSANKAPFTFSNVQQAPVSTQEEEQNAANDEDEPPKVEFTPVVEEGHVYSVKCKVFVKKDGNFSDRGVGNLFLKPVPDSDKVQLIVRANTNLGNLLCNFILSQGIPTQRIGKKDVMLVCLPTPDSKPPPVPILLRVKSPEEADKLLQELEKNKK